MPDRDGFNRAFLCFELDNLSLQLLDLGFEHLPQPCATGRPRAWPMREKIINGIFYVMRAGCPWRLRTGRARRQPFGRDH